MVEIKIEDAEKWWKNLSVEDKKDIYFHEGY